MGFLEGVKKIFIGPSPLISLMLHEHHDIEKIFLKFERSLDKDSKTKSFNALKEKLSRHMYGEEKAIFVMHKKGKVSKTVVVLLKQHTRINELVDEIESKLKQEKNFSKELQEFKSLHKAHIFMEEKDFYYKMDSVLDKYEKKEIVKSYNTYLIGSISQG
jgi:hypothetical protein